MIGIYLLPAHMSRFQNRKFSLAIGINKVILCYNVSVHERSVFGKILAFTKAAIRSVSISPVP